MSRITRSRCTTLVAGHQLSDVVTIGDATLYHGDCLEILPTLPKVDAVITDPPYGIATGIVADRPTKWQRLAGGRPETWDNGVVNLVPALSQTHERGILIVWGGNFYALPPSRGWLSWFKPDAPPSMASFELAWTNMDRNARQIVCSISETNAERVGHPTQKPLKVMRWCIEQAGNPASVLDPFMGSGTTGVACAQLGRKFIGVEIERKYFDIACERIDNAYRQQRMFA
jgi:site-specific DNA-methyltransferase (adenine-specific)